MVKRWVKASVSWTSEVSRNSKKIDSGQKVFYSEVKKKLYNWIIKQRKQGIAVTYSII